MIERFQLHQPCSAHLRLACNRPAKKEETTTTKKNIFTTWLISVCHKMSATALPVGLTEFGKLSWVQLVGDYWRWKYFMWTSSADATYSSKTIRSILTGEMVENCAHSIWISRKFEYVGDPSQMRRRPTGTDRRMLSIATGDYVTGRSAGYENQSLGNLVDWTQNGKWRFNEGLN